jgi:hypothetical protein
MSRLAAVTIVALLAGVAAAGASTAAKPKTIKSYCSPSGDVCYGVFAANGGFHFQITTVARYFQRYRLCWRGPPGGASGYWRCGSYPIFRHGAVWSSKVPGWKTAQQGSYRAEWSLGGPPKRHRGGQLLGPGLSFRVP